MPSPEAFALCAAATPLFLALAERGLLRIAPRRGGHSDSAAPSAWTVRRVAVSAGLAILGLAAFPAILFVLLSTLVWLPWPISLPTAVALLVAGIAGIAAAVIVAADSPRKGSMVRIAGSSA